MSIHGEMLQVYVSSVYLIYLGSVISYRYIDIVTQLDFVSCIGWSVYE